MLRAKFSRNLIRCLMVVVVVFFVGAFTSPAFAEQPISWLDAYTVTSVDDTLCAFPVTIESTVTQTLTAFVNDDGAWVMGHHAGTEQDIFSANGNTLVGQPYHFTIHNKFDPNTGFVRYGSLEGVLWKIPLPDGSLFISSGRIEWDSNFDTVAIHGKPFDWAPVCAALAP